MTPRPARRLLLAAALSALVFAAGLARNGPTRPAAADAPLDRFSAVRAKNSLRAVLSPEEAHPQGSPANARVLARIVAALTAMGYSPSVQEEFVCGGYGVCGTVKNVVARLPGGAPRGAVMLSAHYDSVEAGPGASDDGMGVACALEIARILRLRPPAARPVVFLIDDGEEQGLLGAEAFVSRHPWAKEISAVVNVEARGTSGASYLFETSAGNRGLVRAAAAIPHPVASSLFPTIYRMLPNDTDLTVFQRHGLAGVNFGCIGGVTRYHTPVDDLAHMDLSSLQHQGDNALAMVESLVSEDRPPDRSGDTVFFDVFGAKIVGWPEGWTVPLAAAAILLLAAGLAGLARRRSLSLAQGLRGLASCAGMIVFPAALAFAARAVLRAAGVLPSAWTAHPSIPLAGFWLLSLAASGAVLHLASKRLPAAAVAAGVWGGWALLGGAAAAALPGISFLFLVPLAAAAIPSALDPESRFALAAPMVAALLFLPIAWRLWDALGWDGIAALAALVALAVTPLAPFAARLEAPGRKRLLLGLAAGAAACLLASAGLAPRSPDSPARLTIFWHRDADSGRARWIVDGSPVPRELETAASLGAKATPPFPWSALRARVGPAPGGSAAPPEFRIEDVVRTGGRTRFRGRVVSPRGARFARISFPPSVGVERIAIGGVAVPPLSERALSRSNGWRSYSCVTLPREGIEVEGDLTGPSPEFVLMDRTDGLPPPGAALRAARPGDAVPSQTGDVSIVTRRVAL